MYVIKRLTWSEPLSKFNNIRIRAEHPVTTAVYVHSVIFGMNVVVKTHLPQSYVLKLIK